MKRVSGSLAASAFVAALITAAATAAPARTAPQSTADAPASPPAASASAPAVPPRSDVDPTRGDGMRAYHAAFIERRLGSADSMRLEDVRLRAAEGEDLLRAGRIDEAIARLTEIVEHPRFAAFAEDEPGRAAMYRLGDALASAGVYEPARAYLRRVYTAKGAWEANAPYARRAVRRLVEIALESQNLGTGLDDLKDVPKGAPEETRGEVSYLTGRASEVADSPDAALAAYAEVPKTSRFWAQATYLSGLLHVEHGRYKQGEDLFCKVADPRRQSRTTPVLADERFFAVRDLARLALGRVAHEQLRHDDARYYYYLVPRDSDRLAEALYEAATTRYEKKDYEGARELLDELQGLGLHHRYEDEAAILDAYIDLALCRFDTADKKLVAFVAKYEPVRDGARRVSVNDRAMQGLLAAARRGTDAAAEASTGAATPDALRTIAALVRVDAAYGEIVRRRAVLDREASGLRQTAASLDDIQRNIATNGGLRAASEERADPAVLVADARAALDGARRDLTDLEAAKAPADRIAALREEVTALDARLTLATQSAAAATRAELAGGAPTTDLGGLLRRDAAQAWTLSAGLDGVRQELAKAESILAKDALKRLDLRLSRLLRRARLGRIESVLGRKRALEVEIEGVGNGFLPQGAVDSLDAARFLKDTEEYWPFEGDDWPDEFIGSEAGK